MLDSIFSSALTDTTLTFSNAIVTIGLAIIMGAIISLTYMKTNQSTYSQSFTLTMVVLPVIVAIIILLIGSNIARAFSLAGAFSIIRFRSAPGDPKDIAYVLFTMASGLACGVGAFGYAVMFTIILCVLMFVLSRFNFGAKKSQQKTLKVTIPENLSYEEALDEVFHKFNVVHELKKIRTTELGSLYELVYNVTIHESVNQKEFLDMIRTRNGNLDISLTMSPTTTEY
jgi:ABC-type sugar transport system permease subunit